ncbi:ATP-binding cassette sub-family A member 2 isoform X2 [Drosophila grimshawi]|uniref:GH11111 n=2 Tax=Drosophila grimshawi TaxID=7222 RepID=B4JCW6_DROGR|nr:ATP-binding cassette sub-family A member 2 isoform X2 [Drosophila grimshawi]EDW03205.1 GH11111 [Drosophila grimshawi]
MARSCSSLFYVFLRKNVLYLRYSWLPLCIAFFMWIGVLWAYLHWTNKFNLNDIEEFESKDYNALKAMYPGNELDLLYYAPNTENVNSLMDHVLEELQLGRELIREYNNSVEMQVDMEQQCKGNCFAINFQTLSDPRMNGDFKYSLSSNQLRMSPQKRFVNDEEINHQKSDDEYIREGFLTLQYVIDRQYMSYQQLNADYELRINAIPNLEVNTTHSNILINFGTLFSILFSILLLSTYVVPFVEEKQNGIREFLNIVTPMSFLNGLTFSLIRFVCYVGLLLITLLIALSYGALGLIGFLYIFVLYLLYILANMSYAYLISVCFHTVFYAKIGGLILLVIPYIFSIVRSWLSKLAFYLFCTNSFLEGLDVLQTFSNKRRHFGFADLLRLIKDDASCIIYVYSVLLGQTILYALLYNYLVCVFPGPGGLKRPFLFILNPNTYKKRQRNEYTTSPRGTDAIIISDLCKKFQTSKRETNIADHLSMKIKNKEITVLLGHNGAGKTTMMNMIMGTVPKDAGKIVVCSERDVASYRHLIGFCPQHSVFMSYMTCQEHLEFFAQLRGAKRSDARDWAVEKLRKLNLYDKADEYGCKLSGGMKRRLSLGIAIAGNTKIIILDEPSSGLDIESRRELWDILLLLRKEKAILVTTHYMEEAEVLGDTICILANGTLQENGSPLELKRKSGCGYRLKLEAHETKFLEKETLADISKFIPTAKLLNIVKPTVNICLPYDEVSQYHDMLHSLETNMTKYGIETISITDTTLETVFLNCAGECDQVDTPDIGTRNDAPLLAIQQKHLQHATNALNEWTAIFYKKITFLLSEWRYTCCMLSLPFFSVTAAILLMHSMSVVNIEAALPLNLSQLRTGSVYIYNTTALHGNVEQKLLQYIQQSGLTTKMLMLRGDNTVPDELLQLQRENLADFLEDTIGLVDLSDKSTIEISYASNRYHSSVMLVNMLDTCMLQLASGQPDVRIDATYVPIKRFVSDVSSTRLEYYAVIVPAAIFFSMFYYIALPFRENANGFRQLQPMSRFTYWFATLTFDLLLHTLVCLLLLLLQKLIMPPELYTPEDLKLIVISIFFYGCSYLPILYTLSSSFKSISTISTYLLLMLIVSEIAPLITSNNFQAMKQHATKIAFLRFLPDFNLNHQLRIINENFIAQRRKSMKLLETTTHQFFVYAVVVSLLVMGFFTFVLEHKYHRQRLCDFFYGKTCKIPPKSRSASCITPLQAGECFDECASEERRVKELLHAGTSPDTAQMFPLVVSNLRKSYDGKPAVSGISFAAERGECFGLLGVNGAGKTSIFQMIAANMTMDSGQIQIEGTDIRLNEVAYRKQFGYCPQYDALNKFMTAEQCLRLMAILRGLSWKSDDPMGIECSVMFWLQKMHLLKYRDVPVRNYSGGTKRKLLAAMAMIGAPSLVLLDEPTTGVDPISRRFLWQCIKDFQKRDRTVVLTSHSMDECEELCNRLAIMAKGQFKCLNNICALKRQSGFSIKLKMKIDTETETNVATITNTLNGQFEALELRENHAGTLTYIVQTDQRILWSKVFDVLESYLSDKLNDLVEYYSVNECTLEDIFLKFERQAKSLSLSGSENYV